MGRKRVERAIAYRQSVVDNTIREFVQTDLRVYNFKKLVRRGVLRIATPKEEIDLIIEEAKMVCGKGKKRYQI